MEKAKGIYLWTRISFWALVVLSFFSISNVISSSVASVVVPLFFLSIATTFVLSIVHLKIRKEKTFAICALIFSGVLLLLTLLIVFSMVVFNIKFPNPSW